MFNVQPTLAAPRKSKIPKQSTPSQVRTDEVTDLSDLPVPNPMPLHHSASHSTWVYYHSNSNRRPRPREVMQGTRTSRHGTPQEEETEAGEDPKIPIEKNRGIKMHHASTD